MTIVSRTVLDLRSMQEKYVSQTLLLAASWHRHCADHSPLEVYTVGHDSRVLHDFLDDIGASCVPIPPSPNDDFSKTSNKIEASHADAGGRPVLLLDNDVCFVGGIRQLLDLPAGAIAASEAGNLRVTDEQWSLIREQLGLPLLRRRFMAVNARAADGTEPVGNDSPDMPERYLYLNSGVVRLPGGHDHRALWRTHQRRVYGFFKDHPLSTGAVTGSDQAGFASSVAAHGEFAWLPIGFNYRRGCFRVGMATPDQIRILHLTGDVEGDFTLAQRIEAYWKKWTFPRIETLPTSVPQVERRRRADIAQTVLETVLGTVRGYELERWLAAYRKERAA